MPHPPRRWPVRAYLLLIVFALIVPGLLFCAALMLRLQSAEHARSLQGAQAAALRTADALDREVTNIRAVLRVLAASPALAARDMPAFDRQARAVGETMGQNIVLTDAAGQQHVNTRTPPGTPLPRSNAMDGLRRAVDTGQPVLSDLFRGAVAQAPAVAVLMPVMEDGRAAWVLSTSMQPRALARLLEAQALPPGWGASIIDGHDLIVARSVEHDRFVGQRVTADLVASMQGEQGTWIGTAADGTEVLAAYARAGGTGWRVVVGVPLAIVEAPFRATLLSYAAAGAGTLALALLLAWRLAHRISAPLRGLAQAGMQAGTHPAPAVASGIQEVDALAKTLAATQSGLVARADALAAERARLAAIIDTVPVGLVIAAPTGEILSGNAQVERMFRHPVLMSRSDQDYGEWAAFHADGRQVQAGEYPLSRVLHGADRAELTCHYQRGDGTRFWVNLVAAPIRDADGAGVAGGVVAILDIDEVVRAREAKGLFAETLQQEVAARTAELVQANQRLRDEMDGRAAAEGQLRQAQKMEAVGRLTGGIAHDFNNLLTIVVGSLDLLGRRVEDARQRRLVDNAMEGATRAATLTARLLAFSRQQPLQPQAVDPNQLVSGMEELLQRTLGEAITVRMALAAGAWPVHADPNQLENALLNLAVNARDAMMAAADGGVLTVATANRVVAAGELGQDVPAGEYAEVMVRDTGTGMPPEVAAQVFEPFYTTKPQGQGTGLGLSQVHGFVKQSGGHVAVETAPGQGTAIRMLLPRLLGGAAAAAPPPAPALAPPRADGEVVLVVEDEAGVRRFTVEALQELGYAVVEAGTAADGLRRLAAHPEAVLLFTDVVLPDRSGRVLAAEARRLRPGLPVLFTTGYARDGAGVAAGPDLIGKPFTVAALGEKLRAVLDGA